MLTVLWCRLLEVLCARGHRLGLLRFCSRDDYPLENGNVWFWVSSTFRSILFGVRDSLVCGFGPVSFCVVSSIGEWFFGISAFWVLGVVQLVVSGPKALCPGLQVHPILLEPLRKGRRQRVVMVVVHDSLTGFHILFWCFLGVDTYISC